MMAIPRVYNWGNHVRSSREPLFGMSAPWAGCPYALRRFVV